MATTYKYGNVTIPNGGYTVTGTSGTVLATGLGYATGTNWVTTATSASSYYHKQPKVKITEDDIVLDGLSLATTLRDLQSKLAIMVPDPALEKEFDELKACADEYRRLEAKFLEQMKMWKTLKDADNK